MKNFASGAIILVTWLLLANAKQEYMLELGTYDPCQYCPSKTGSNWITLMIKKFKRLESTDNYPKFTTNSAREDQRQDDEDDENNAAINDNSDELNILKNPEVTSEPKHTIATQRHGVAGDTHIQPQPVASRTYVLGETAPHSVSKLENEPEQSFANRAGETLQPNPVPVSQYGPSNMYTTISSTTQNNQEIYFSKNQILYSTYPSEYTLDTPIKDEDDNNMITDIKSSPVERGDRNQQGTVVSRPETDQSRLGGAVVQNSSSNGYPKFTLNYRLPYSAREDQRQDDEDDENNAAINDNSDELNILKNPEATSEPKHTIATQRHGVAGDTHIQPQPVASRTYVLGETAPHSVSKLENEPELSFANRDGEILQPNPVPVPQYGPSNMYTTISSTTPTNQERYFSENQILYSTVDTPIKDEDDNNNMITDIKSNPVERSDRDQQGAIVSRPESDQNGLDVSQSSNGSNYSKLQPKYMPPYFDGGKQNPYTTYTQPKPLPVPQYGLDASAMPSYMDTMPVANAEQYFSQKWNSELHNTYGVPKLSESFDAGMTRNEDTKGMLPTQKRGSSWRNNEIRPVHNPASGFEERGLTGDSNNYPDRVWWNGDWYVKAGSRQGESVQPVERDGNDGRGEGFDSYNYNIGYGGRKGGGGYAGDRGRTGGGGGGDVYGVGGGGGGYGGGGGGGRYGGGGGGYGGGGGGGGGYGGGGDVYGVGGGGGGGYGGGGGGGYGGGGGGGGYGGGGGGYGGGGEVYGVGGGGEYGGRGGGGRYGGGGGGYGGGGGGYGGGGGGYGGGGGGGGGGRK